MQRRGELTLYPGKVTPVRLFLEDALDYLRGVDIASLSADRFRQSEAVQVFEAAGLRPSLRIEWRGQGWKDGAKTCGASSAPARPRESGRGSRC